MSLTRQRPRYTCYSAHLEVKQEIEVQVYPGDIRPDFFASGRRSSLGIYRREREAESRLISDSEMGGAAVPQTRCRNGVESPKASGQTGQDAHLAAPVSTRRGETT